MPRSLKKGPFVDLHLQNKVDKAKATNDKNLSKLGQGGHLSLHKW